MGDDLDDQSFDDRLRLSGSDDAADSDEAYLDSVENNKRRNHHQSGDHGRGEHLVKPSQIKNKKKQPGKDFVCLVARDKKTVFFSCVSYFDQTPLAATL